MNHNRRFDAVLGADLRRVLATGIGELGQIAVRPVLAVDAVTGGIGELAEIADRIVSMGEGVSVAVFEGAEGLSRPETGCHLHLLGRHSILHPSRR